MRIIGGDLRGRRISVPDDGTRPTSDRVRESIFNMLAARVDVAGASVLDLYAGSGALGLEALSRGATSAVFVDSARRATSVITANIAELGVRTSATVITRPVEAYVQAAGRAAHDLVFLDPPYAIDPDAYDAVLEALAAGWLAPDAVVVVERSSRTREPGFPSGWEVDVSKNYGDTVVDLVYAG